MKRNIHKNLLGAIKSKGILAVAGGLLLVSCGAQMGGYSETDGVYYDPNKDTLPEGVIINDRGNRVGEDYNYYQDDSNLIQNAEINSRTGRYEDWNSYNWNNTATDSDWGMYAGSETNYYDNSWGWGWGNPWGWGGWNNPYWGWGGGWDIGLSWGGSWGWGAGWNLGWGYSPFWGYNPYWGWGGNPYWGWGGYWGGNYYAPYYRRSSANGRGFNTYNGSFANKYGVTSSNGFRRSSTGTGSFRDNANNGGFRGSNNSGGFRQGNTTNGGFRNQNGVRPHGGFRNQGQPRPNYNYQQPSQPRNDGGFRNNGGFNNSNSGGGFRSGGGGFGGGSSGGGFRSGGGGGGGFRGGR